MRLRERFQISSLLVGAFAWPIAHLPAVDLSPTELRQRMRTGPTTHVEAIDDAFARMVAWFLAAITVLLVSVIYRPAFAVTPPLMGLCVVAAILHSFRFVPIHGNPDDEVWANPTGLRAIAARPGNLDVVAAAVFLICIWGVEVLGTSPA
jgi:hypothetical protein